MKHVRLHLALFILSILGTCCTAMARGGSARQVKAVLVMLSAEQNRTTWLLQHKRYADLEVFRKDVAAVQHAAIADFHDHFNYCPVYYFTDTDLHAVLAGQFEGVLMDANMYPAANLPLHDTADDYLIVYYGDPMWQSKKGKMRPTSIGDQGGKPTGPGLVICDYRMRQVHYIIARSAFLGRKAKYFYASNKFNIQYVPTAMQLNDKLARKNAYYNR